MRGARTALMLSVLACLSGCSSLIRVEVRNGAPWDADVRLRLLERGRGTVDVERVVLGPGAWVLREYDLEPGRSMQVQIERLGEASDVYARTLRRGERRLLTIEDTGGRLDVRDRRSAW